MKENTIMKITFGRRLTDEEFALITELLDNNITDDWFAASSIVEVNDEDLSNS